MVSRCLPPLANWEQPCGFDLARGHLNGLFGSHDIPGFQLQSMFNLDSFDSSTETGGWAAYATTLEPRQLALLFDLTMVSQLVPCAHQYVGKSQSCMQVSQLVLTSGSATGGRITAGSVYYTRDRGFLDLSANWHPVRR